MQLGQVDGNVERLEVKDALAVPVVDLSTVALERKCSIRGSVLETTGISWSEGIVR